MSSRLIYLVVLPAAGSSYLILCDPTRNHQIRAHHGLDIMRCNYVLIRGKLWREMTSRSNCDATCFHTCILWCMCNEKREDTSV